MNEQQKRGALIFFGKGGCSQCHSVAGDSNEMFSDFKMHVIGVPQIAPAFGAGKGNVIFDGPGQDEDFGLEQITANAADRYKFRSSPLRNAALQVAFFHNGAMTRIEDAIRHHLDVFSSARGYDPEKAGVDKDLRYRVGPIEPVLARIDPLLQNPISLSGGEFEALVAFVRDSLLDSRAKKHNLCPLIPDSVPSGYSTMIFEECH
jgi:cytochrome c peroxidase